MHQKKLLPIFLTIFCPFFRPPKIATLPRLDPPKKPQKMTKKWGWQCCKNGPIKKGSNPYTSGVKISHLASVSKFEHGGSEGIFDRQTHFDHSRLIKTPRQREGGGTPPARGGSPLPRLAHGARSEPPKQRVSVDISSFCSL